MKVTKQPPIIEITKSDFAKIFVSVDTYKNSTFLSIRQFYKDACDVYKPSPKGVTLPPDKINDLIQALQKLSGVNAAK